MFMQHLAIFFFAPSPIAFSMIDPCMTSFVDGINTFTWSSVYEKSR
jgi:hypothetical protein